MDSIKRKVLFNKPGGTASKNAIMARVTLPPEYVKALNITQEEKEIVISLEKDKICIKKA
jgi:hypothetical protein